MVLSMLHSGTVCFIYGMVDLSHINWLTTFIGVVLIAITSTFLGLFIAVSVSEVFEAQTFSNFFRFPMMFLCGLFIPIENLPVFVRPLSYVLPLTYGADLLKGSINETYTITAWISLLVLVLFGLILFGISTYNIKKKWIY